MAELIGLRTRIKSLSQVAFRGGPSLLTMTGLGEAKRLQGMHLAPGAFDVLGVRPLLGRTSARAKKRRLRTGDAPRARYVATGVQPSMRGLALTQISYTGVEVDGSQRTRRSQFLVGYTRGFQHLDGTWQPNDPASFIQPAAFANNRGIGTIRGNENNSLSGTAQARNPMWIKHALRLAGSYNAPWGLTLSSNLNIFSGPYTGPIVRLLAAPDPQFGPPTLVLSSGRIVANPLATTVRFAHATRGEGQLQAPPLAQWNARAGKRFTLGHRKFEVALSLLNITNRDALQEFLSGHKQIGSPNFAYGPDGTFRGQNRQAARTAQMSLQFEF